MQADADQDLEHISRSIICPESAQIISILCFAARRKHLCTLATLSRLCRVSEHGIEVCSVSSSSNYARRQCARFPTASEVRMQDDPRGGTDG